MEIIILLISISVLIAAGFLAIFYWNYKSGQYDDTYTPSIRMLLEDNAKPPLKTRLRSAEKKSTKT